MKLTFHFASVKISAIKTSDGKLRPYQKLRNFICGTDVAGVEGAGDGGIGGAFEDGAAVGKDGHFVGRDAGAQEEIVAADISDGAGEAMLQLCEIERAGVFVDLNGVAAAHGDVRLGLAFEVGKFVAGAGAAGGIAWDVERLHMAGPDIAGDEAVMEGFGAAGEEFDGFGGLEGCDQVHDWAEDADGVAGFFGGGSGGIDAFHKASQAGGCAGLDGHGEAITGDAGGVNPGETGLDGIVINKEAGFEVVGAIENELVSQPATL